MLIEKGYVLINIPLSPVYFCVTVRRLRTASVSLLTYLLTSKCCLGSLLAHVII